MSSETRMDVLLIPTKWQQFLKDASARWPFLDVNDNSIAGPDDIAVRLRRDAGLSRRRSEWEVRQMVEMFNDKVRLAA